PIGALALHDALPISHEAEEDQVVDGVGAGFDPVREPALGHREHAIAAPADLLRMLEEVLDVALLELAARAVRAARKDGLGCALHAQDPRAAFDPDRRVEATPRLEGQLRPPLVRLVGDPDRDAGVL